MKEDYIELTHKIYLTLDDHQKDLFDVLFIKAFHLNQTDLIDVIKRLGH